MLRSIKKTIKQTYTKGLAEEVEGTVNLPIQFNYILVERLHI
jgi:hypothetical protein